MFILYLDKKKLASHPFILTLVFYADHRWIWMTDVKNKKFHVLDPFHKKSPLKERTTLNKFILSCLCFLYKFLGFCLLLGYVISRMRVFPGVQPLMNKDDEIEVPYVNIAGQHTSINLSL
ncbi:hypothetical protein Ahy_A07g035805 [Arachis hypogaea]|uniref:Ubiquitin-like protease family profile domain-containing protein n=1 Tax=Arachis hypogaea TaxID=3818 RepID=A0A445CEK3_ARAHY|nr:hypothetical protein Ahy_A07g035805 [Arachis hypogaea]